ncbi:MAG: hypothetical protein AAFQ24_04970 [Pseudomonadota bacterium]
MTSVNEQKRRASIAYILRRRKRGRKTGANSGRTINSVNRKIRGHMTFTPAGSAMDRSRYLTLAATVAAISLPLLCLIVLGVAASRNAETLAHDGLDPLGWVLISAVAVLALSVAIFSMAYLVLFVWRWLSSLLTHKNE